MKRHLALPFVTLALLSAAACSTSDATDPAGSPATSTSAPAVPAETPADSAPSAEAPTDAAPSAEATAPPAAPPAAEPESKGLSDGSFTSEDPLVKDSGLDTFGGTARVTNTSDKSKTAILTYTVFLDGEQVATMTGAATEVEAGSTSTVQLISTDPFVEGGHTFDFQVDGEF